MTECLKHKAISGAFWGAVQRFGTMLVSFISNMILARLLTPDDFGCIGMLMIFIAVSNTFIDGGFGSALIQKKEPDQNDYSTVFYWNLLLSITLYCILWITSPWIASFYKIGLLRNILCVQGIILITNSLSIVQINQLKKNLQFKKYSIISLIAVCISAVIGVILAFSDYGVWSLVIQQLSISFLTMLILWFTCKWRPALVFSMKSFKQLFSFGGYILLSNLMNTICNNIQGLIIGRKFSAYDMGCYAQARKLEEIPSTSFSSVVAQVVYPLFAKVQDDTIALRNIQKQSIEFIGFITIPIMVLLWSIAEPLINLLYGNQWAEAIPLFRILCIGGIAISFQDVNYYLVAAVGQSDKLFRWNIVKRIFGISLIFLGMFLGIKGILYGMVLSSFLIYFINAFLAAKISSYRISVQFKDIIPFFVFSAIPAGIIFYLMPYIDINLIVKLMLLIIIYASIYLGGIFLYNRNILLQYFHMAKQLFRKK